MSGQSPPPRACRAPYLLAGLFAFCQATLIVMAWQGGRVSPWFAGLYALSFVFLPGLVRAFPWTGRRGFGLAIGLGLAFRLVWLAAPPDWDIWRYIWEGLVQLAGANPYLLPPDAPALAPLAQAHHGVWSGVFAREVTAIYPPGLQLLFRFAASVDPSPGFFRLLMVLLDAGCLAVLALLMARRGLRPGRLLYWALNPLALLFLAGDGHAEPAQLLPLLLGLWCLESGRARRGFLLLGLAATMKYFALLALPFVLRRDTLSRAWWALAPLALFLPFAEAGPRIFATLAAFSGQHFWGFAAELLWPAFGAVTPGLLLLLLAACLGLILLAEHDPVRGAALAFGSLVLCLPTLHPWYLSLAVVFLPLFPSRAWLWLCAAQALCLPVDWTRLGLMDWDWLWRVRYGGFLLLLAWGAWRDDRLEREHAWPAPRTLSLVIPTLNEAGDIADCIRAAREGGATQIIVADGGSTDETPGIATRHGALVVASVPGRGEQIAAGARTASGDVLAVLHADCRPAPDVFARMLAALAARPAAPGGAVTMGYARGGPHGFAGPGAAFIAMLNNLRGLLCSLSFGDQLQFVRRETLDVMGGFPRLPLMEDVELSLRMKALGPCLFLGGGVVPLVRVSGRRWARAGFCANAGGVVRLLGRWLLERRFGLNRLAGLYYAKYYGPAAREDVASNPHQP